jgi:hypothetical protein
MMVLFYLDDIEEECAQSTDESCEMTHHYCSVMLGSSTYVEPSSLRDRLGI